MAISRFHLANSKSTIGCYDLDAGIADEDVEAPECLDDLGRSIIHLLLICDVHGDADSALARGIDLARSGVCCVLIEVRNCDLGAFAGEKNCDLLADTAGRTSHDCDFVF
jgi:hypothetical protein